MLLDDAADDCVVTLTYIFIVTNFEMYLAICTDLANVIDSRKIQTEL